MYESPVVHPSVRHEFGPGTNGWRQKRNFWHTYARSEKVCLPSFQQNLECHWSFISRSNFRKDIVFAVAQLRGWTQKGQFLCAFAAWTSTRDTTPSNFSQIVIFVDNHLLKVKYSEMHLLFNGWTMERSFWYAFGSRYGTSGCKTWAKS